MEEAELAYAHLARPFACIDLDALDQNIAFVNTACCGKGVRIATKSVRSTELLKYIAERLEHPAGWMTFDLSETVRLLEEGFNDLLIGYPQLERSLLERIIPFIREGRCVIFMVDTIEQWQWLDRIGQAHAIRFEICIDLNVSTDFKLIYFGTKRSSLTTLALVEKLLAQAQSFSHTRITGIMGYEAQIAGVTDMPDSGWQAPLINFLKMQARRRVSSFRKMAVNRIRQEYSDIRFVNGGGSGSIEFTVTQEEVTELTVGSAFYFPALFSRYRNLPLKPAATFALRVTRKPQKDIVVCQGGGYIASGATSDDKNPVPVWPENLTLLKNEGAGEVQTPLLNRRGKIEIGDTIYFRHAKAGELCERFAVLHGRRGSNYHGAFKTYRGEGSCFL